MSSPQRTIVIVAGILVLVVAAGCGSTNSADGVRRIELVSNDRQVAAAPSTTIGDEVNDEVERDDTDAEAELRSVSNVASGSSSLSNLVGDAVAIGDADVPNDEQFIAALDAALASGDLCAVWSAMSQVALDADDSARLASSMRLLSSVMRTANELVPSTLEANWTRATDDLDELAAELDDGEIVKVLDAFEDPSYIEPQRGIVDWVTENCA